jgi:hypothetical protein
LAFRFDPFAAEAGTLKDSVSERFVSSRMIERIGALWLRPDRAAIALRDKRTQNWQTRHLLVPVVAGIEQRLQVRFIPEQALVSTLWDLVIADELRCISLKLTAAALAGVGRAGKTLKRSARQRDSFYQSLQVG